VTLRELPPDEARSWIVRSLGLPDHGDLLEAFDPERLPLEPTVFEAN
jgi:hypothetical protein